MGVIDVESLTADLSPESPCGANLEYDPLFGEIERASQGKPEQQFGETIVPAEEPNWRDVKSKGLELLRRTRDLRVAVLVSRALLVTDGFPGFRDGLALVKGLLERQWAAVHPQLDPTDGNDPTMRVNVVSSLAGQDTVIRAVRDAPLVNARGLGRFTLREVQVATGAAPPPADGAAAPDPSAIDAVFQGCDLEELSATANAIESATAFVGGIEAALNEKVGASCAPDLAALAGTLSAAHQVVAERLARRGVGVTSTAAGAAGTGAPGAPAPLAGEIASRDDVIRVIDRICDYYGRSEPSSPVPILLRRARRLVNKEFLDIVRDLTPDGLAQAENIRGIVDSGGGPG